MIARELTGRRRVGASALLLGVLVGALALPGCARVRPYEREFLSDPIMDRAARLMDLDRDQKWLEAREGSIGGASGAGGGCACK